MITMTITGIRNEPFTSKDGRAFERLYFQGDDGKEYKSLKSDWNEKWAVGDRVSFNWTKNGKFWNMSPATNRAAQEPSSAPSQGNLQQVLDRFDALGKVMREVEVTLMKRIELLEKSLNVLVTFPPPKE